MKLDALSSPLPQAPPSDWVLLLLLLLSPLQTGRVRTGFRCLFVSRAEHCPPTRTRWCQLSELVGCSQLHLNHNYRHSEDADELKWKNSFHKTCRDGRSAADHQPWRSLSFCSRFGTRPFSTSFPSCTFPQQQVSIYVRTQINIYNSLFSGPLKDTSCKR